MRDAARPLFMASRNGHFSIVKYLVSRCAQVNHQRDDQASPLRIASQKGHSAAVKELLLTSASVNLPRSESLTSVDLAKEASWDEVVGYLATARKSYSITVWVALHRKPLRKCLHIELRIGFLVKPSVDNRG